MGTIILPNAVKREEGYIYYIDGEGSICRTVKAKGRTKNAVNKRKPAKKIAKKVIKKVTKKTAKKVVKAKKK